jgi:hypothetical protein
MLQPPREEAFALISNALKKGVAPNYSHLSPPTRIGKNSTKNLKVMIRVIKAQLPR